MKKYLYQNIKKKFGIRLKNHYLIALCNIFTFDFYFYLNFFSEFE
jgi:hypothetical protein